MSSSEPKSESQSEQEPEPRIYKIAIMILPLGVIIGTIVFMVMYFKLEHDDERKQEIIAAHGVNYKDLYDMVGKFNDRIGPRSIDSNEGRKGLERATAMIEGRLGVQNVGLKIQRGEGEAAHGKLWQSRWVNILGEKHPKEIVIIATTLTGKGETADANCVATTALLASANAAKKPARTLRFVFLPYDLPDDQQNAWLLKRCLTDGEKCAAIIGFKTMKSELFAGSKDWVADLYGEGEALWGYMQGHRAKFAFEPSAKSAPAVWLTHAVFSADSWKNDDRTRLERTEAIAPDLSKWILKAAGGELGGS